MRERELKHSTTNHMARRRASLPMRERELKRLSVFGRERQAGSLPMRERELKQPVNHDVYKVNGRSPCGSAN